MAQLAGVGSCLISSRPSGSPDGAEQWGLCSLLVLLKGFRGAGATSGAGTLTSGL